MAAVFGSITEYVFESEDITEWLERLEQWFIANELNDNADRKRALLLSNVGARGYKLLRSLAQNKPNEKSYAQLKTLLTEHLSPKPNEIAQRYVFYKRDRRTGETVKDYVAALRKLSEHCNFADKLEDHLRDKFVCGLNDERLQQKLLATQNLTLKVAVDNAVAMEAAVRSAKQIHGVTTEVRDVYKFGEGQSGHKFGGKGKGFKVNPGKSNQNGKECFRCGSSAHLANKCFFKDKKCFGCGKPGHTKERCRTKGINFEAVVDEDEEEIEEGIFTLNLYNFSVEEWDSDDKEIPESEPLFKRNELEVILEEDESEYEFGNEKNEVMENEETFEFVKDPKSENAKVNDTEIEIVNFNDEAEKTEKLGYSSETIENVAAKEIVKVSESDEKIEILSIAAEEVEKLKDSEGKIEILNVATEESESEDSKVEIVNLEKEKSKNAEAENSESEVTIVNVYKLGDEETSSNDPFIVPMKLNGTKTDMELDTGAAVTVTDLDTYNRVGGEPLEQSRLRLRTCTGEIVKPKGLGHVDVEYGKFRLRMPIIVVDVTSPYIIGQRLVEEN